MSTAVLAAFLRPFAIFLFMVLIGLPVRYAIQRWMKEGSLKRLLLYRWESGKTKRSP